MLKVLLRGDRRRLAHRLTLAGVFALVYGAAAGEGVPKQPTAAEGLPPTVFGGKNVDYVLVLDDGALRLRSSDGKTETRVELSLVTKGVAAPITFREVSRSRMALKVLASIDRGDDGVVNVPVAFSIDFATDVLTVEATPVSNLAEGFYLRADISTSAGAFVPGKGPLEDLETATGDAVVLDDRFHPLVMARAKESMPITVRMTAGEDRKRHLVVESAESDDHGTIQRARTQGFRFALGSTPQATWKETFTLLGEATFRVAGFVTGTKERAYVYGIDEEGRPTVRTLANEQNRFEVFVPKRVVSWYATLDATETSPALRHPPGTPWDLRLDVAAGGELDVRIVDQDTEKPITARLYVHGIEGSVDPSFGPDYRGTGAGPLMDVLRGVVETPLPAGRYRLVATKGVEWSADAQTVEVLPGHTQKATLTLRHVVPTPTLVACDLHVHARPSFDSPVSQEDRVVSLVAAGIEFAVPSEHNIVGDYGPSISALDVQRDLATVTGVEVTTFSPRFGHFGLFPFPVGRAPVYKGTNATALFHEAKKGDPSRILQVNHPRMPEAIGYFTLVGYDRGNNHVPGRMRTDFDALEVYNGYEAQKRELVELVMRDWFSLLNLGHHFTATGNSDSHRIQYQWAGYPRTYARVEGAQGGDGKSAVDTRAVVQAIKDGHALVTSGPIVEIAIAGTTEGNVATIATNEISVDVRVWAPPWIDVTSFELIAGGKVVTQVPIPTKPLSTGPEEGSPADSNARALRYQGRLRIGLPDDAHWIVGVARGTRPMSDVLAFMPIQPMGFTNPIWLTR